ncbi:MAG TPA: serine/threonine-protein kinase [Gemmataceae bacterium]|nr:serine/threonine-protein kinase [Gemmataceae bacterium]
MPALTTADEFLDLLRKSRLVDDARLDAFLKAPSSALPDKPRLLAELFLGQGFITRFQAAQLLAGRWRGFLVAGGKYKLLELLGVGGMGKVYLCEHVRMKRLVALKVLPYDRLEEPTALERFEREARAAASLNHPNIVRAHDLDTDPGTNLHFLVMEYVDGASLQKIVKNFGPMDVVRAGHYIAQAAEGLQHAHEAGWVHRDVKPANLLLDRSGTIKILDMGLARFFHDDASELTKQHDKSSVIGTADYLAPEQIVDSSEVDIRADVYSLGGTFYYLLTGRSPFGKGTVPEKLLWHQHREPDPIRNARPDVPSELEAVIVRMLTKEPAERFQEPNEVVEALRPWTSEPIGPPADEQMPRLCPAIAAYGVAGTSLLASGSTASHASLRSQSTRRVGRVKRGPPGGANGGPRFTRPTLRPLFSGAALVAFIIATVWWFTRHEVAPSGRVVTGSRGMTGESPPPAIAERLPPTVPDQTLFITRNQELATPDRPDVLPSIAAALAKARPGHTLLVLDGEIEEQVTLDGSHLAGLHLESGLPGGRRVTWRPPADAPADEPLLRLRNAGGVQVKGFILDGANRVETLVHVSGACPGLNLTDLYLTDGLQASLVLADCAAPEEQPLTVERVRFTTVRDYHEGASLVKERNGPLVRPAAIRCAGNGLKLLVRYCRIEGLFQAGVRIEGPVDAKVRLCRFYTLNEEQRPPEAWVSDVVYIPASAAVRLQLASNTVARFTNLLRFDKLPADGRNAFLVRSNLMIGGDAFVAAGHYADPAAARMLFAGSAGNVARPQNCNRGLPVIDKTTIDFSSIDLRLNSDHFLRYERSGDTLPLLKAGADGEPAGVPPVD